MNGQLSFSDNIIKTINRRAFLLRAGMVMGGVMLNACVRKVLNNSKYNITGKLRGPNAKAGHLLRDGLPIPVPTEKKEVDTLIIGGGISGLSAARWLKKQGHNNFLLMELEDHAGGNSYFGSNSVSSYPLGAHYIPIINNEDTLLIDFLHEHNVITHFNEQGLPYYNEFYLCFDPEERLLINGHWQEGLVPDFGVPKHDREQIINFFLLVEKLKVAKGNDGEYAFNIPVNKSSSDEQFRKLDQVSFRDYLQTEGFTSEYLHWYLNYCCKDDFGMGMKDISAWAGLHYFASRKGKAANTEINSVITWPEGNGWLMKRLRENVKEHIQTSKMAYEVSLSSENVLVKVYDTVRNVAMSIIAKNVIMASPQYVNQKLLKNIERPNLSLPDMHYSPWLIANITVNGLPSEAKGMVLCWDNVAYNTPSVGYVNANQQDIKGVENKKVLTYYLPLCDKEPRLSRLAAYSRTYEQWLDIIIPEMEQMHPGISAHIEAVDLWLWGHGMIAPVVGYMWGKTREAAQEPIDDKVFFAHSDLSGISIFEEAFHQGINAANMVLNSINDHAGY